MELVLGGRIVELVLEGGILELVLVGGSTPSHLFSPGVKNAIRGFKIKSEVACVCIEEVILR